MYVKWVSDQIEEAQPQLMTDQVAYELLLTLRHQTGAPRQAWVRRGHPNDYVAPLAEYVLSVLNPNQWLSAGASRATRRVLSHALESGVEA
jgi:hypothetical protein